MGQSRGGDDHDKASGFIPRTGSGNRPADRDDKDKAARYEHLGMRLDRVRHCGERFHMYDLIRE